MFQQIEQALTDERRKPVSRGDAGLKSYVGLEHREKIKQIYAQTE